MERPPGSPSRDLSNLSARHGLMAVGKPLIEAMALRPTYGKETLWRRE
jgi:hypothetical protein